MYDNPSKPMLKYMYINSKVGFILFKFYPILQQIYNYWKVNVDMLYT